MVLSSYIGATVKRKEDPRLITGSSTYVDDLKLNGTVHVAFVRSIYPHANIISIDGSDALALPGVHRILTGAELADMLTDMYPMESHSEVGHDLYKEIEDESDIIVPKVQPMPSKRVRYVGEPLVAVVADTRALAEDAAALVMVEYEELEPAVDPYASMQDGAPQLYEKVENNIAIREYIDHGDTASALAAAPVRFTIRIRSPRCHPVPIEPRGIVAVPDPITRGLTFWTSTQAPHWNRNSIAEALGLSQNQVRAIAPEVGGGFGCKIGAYPEEFVVAALAREMNRPVKWIESRSENFPGHQPRPQSVVRV